MKAQELDEFDKRRNAGSPFTKVNVAMPPVKAPREKQTKFNEWFNKDENGHFCQNPRNVALEAWEECKKQIMEYLNAKLIDDDGDPMNFVVKEDIRNIEKIF